MKLQSNLSTPPSHLSLAFLVALIAFGYMEPLTAQIDTRESQQLPQVPPFRSRVAGTALETAVDPAAYKVGPGDVFLVSILGLPNYIYQATISPDGVLTLPNVGTLNTGGMSAERVIDSVIELVKKNYPAMSASCSLYGIRELRVSVAGAVARPGLYQVTPVSRLTDALRLAGGMSSTAALHRLVIEREGGPVTLDLRAYLDKGDMTANPTLEAGDRIVVPYGDPSMEMVSVRGLAGKPRYYAIRPGETLGQFLARWYNPGSLADLAAVTVHRDRAGTLAILRPQPEELSTLALKSGDAIYVNVIAGVMVLGQVRRPGRYEYYPGLTVADYIALAAGVTGEGAEAKAQVTGNDGQRRRGDDEIQAGDSIKVPMSARSILVGQSGLVQVALAILNLSLTFIAASR